MGTQILNDGWFRGVRTSLAGFLTIGSIAASAENAAPTSPSLTEPQAVPVQTVDWIDTLGLDRLVEQNSLLSWGILLFMIFAGLVGGKVIAYVLHRIKQQLEKTHFSSYGMVLDLAAGSAQLAVFAVALRIGLAQLVMSEALAFFSSDLVLLLLYIALFWYVFNLVSILEIWLKKITAHTGSDLDDMIVPLVRKSLRIFVVILALLLIAENVFGQDIGAWLAGLGLAGLAVSLAAQDSVKNIFGSMTILFDRPFKVGDRVNFGGFEGPVEAIGFRSTKIRTLTGHLVTVPNSRIVNEPVENIGARPYIRRLMNVTITYDTTLERIQKAVDIIRNILEEPGIREPIHGKVGNNELPPRVYFNDFNAASLNIIVLYWFIPPMFVDYLEHAQRVNLRLFEEFEKAGIDFAFPTQTLYLAGDQKRKLAVNLLGSEPS